MSRRQTIIDTDPGLDDAVAILFAVHSGLFDVIGLNAVAGNLGIDVTTRNAGRLLALLGRRDIPVLSGAAEPLRRRGIHEAAIHGDDGLGGVHLPEPIPALPGYAPFWIADQLRMAPSGSIDLLALGPLTNIALLLRDHADAAARIGRLIVMGGVLHEKGNVGPRSEFNFAADPEAADMVLRAGLPVTLVPLDVTRQVRADVDFIGDLRGASAAANAAADLLAAYVKAGRESRPLHDPCVMLYAVAPQLFGVSELGVRIDVSQGEDAGAVIVDPAGTLVQVLTSVDVDAALEMLGQGLA